jgi:hypothetical protein
MVLLTGGAEEDSTFVGTGPEDFQLDCFGGSWLGGASFR